jgi:hypothetical protein
VPVSRCPGFATTPQPRDGGGWIGGDQVTGHGRGTLVERRGRLRPGAVDPHLEPHPMPEHAEDCAAHLLTDALGRVGALLEATRIVVRREWDRPCPCGKAILRGLTNSVGAGVLSLLIKVIVLESGGSGPLLHPGL